MNVACKGKPQKATTTPARSRGPEGFFERIIDRQQELVDGLEGIEAPDELDSDFTALKAAARDRLALLERAAAALKANPRARLESLGKEAEGIQKQVAQASRAIGVKECG